MLFTCSVTGHEEESEQLTPQMLRLVRPSFVRFSALSSASYRYLAKFEHPAFWGAIRSSIVPILQAKRMETLKSKSIYTRQLIQHFHSLKSGVALQTVIAVLLLLEVAFTVESLSFLLV